MSDQDKTDAWKALDDRTASFLQVQKAVTLLEKAEERLTDRTIGLSSNVQIDRLALYLRRHALIAGVRLKVMIGGYDTLIADVRRFSDAGVDYLLTLPFFDNMLPAFEARVNAGLDTGLIDQVEQRFIDQYSVALSEAAAIPEILVANLHRIWPAIGNQKDDVANVCERFQSGLADVVGHSQNAALIDIEASVAEIGQHAALDRRFYAQAKAPYALPMLNEIGRRVAAATRGFGGHFYKVLALDCDNTLWGGVIGEDLLNGIKLSPFEFPGNVYWRAQQEFLGLERSGAILCLCTKNNPADVQEVLDSHPEMVLRGSNITILKVNWDDKPTNLRAIAKELNVGLDSIVFVDDSSYELEGVRSQLPEVKTFRVPENISDYSLVTEQIKNLFVAGKISTESRAKSQQYKQKIQSESMRGQFGSQEDYLASLDLRATLSRDAIEVCPRVSELTQKSNQFNLTTRRYSVGEITTAMEARSRAVYSVVVDDKLGSAGLTAVAIMRFDGDVAEVETFLMSCRVIGRGIEEAIWPLIATDAMQQGCTRIRGRFIRTAKNMLVDRFFDQLGFEVEAEDAGGRSYIVDLDALLVQKSPWVEVVRA